jgi:CheY-like chemotaxis protein
MARSATILADKPQSVVMVVEPDIVVRLAIADYLRECGYAVVETGNAEESLIVLESGRSIDVVFTEIELPQMSGFELARVVRARYPGVDVILTSSPTASAEKASGLCDDGPLQKPYDPEEVLQRIKRLRNRGSHKPH